VQGKNMSEMLGNRYFIARKYNKAAEQLEEALSDSNDPRKIKKKLIICYIEAGKTKKALRLFCDLLLIDPDLIINTDPYHEDCPCPELVVSREKSTEIGQMTAEDLEGLAMLYLYCDVERSLYYFRKALAESKNKKIITSIIKRISPLIRQ
jgi:tetratricopeptide (TPR) repeat protein